MKRGITEIFILAGGLSTRMGRDKSRVRLGPRSMLGHVRNAAKATGLPVRIVRRDAVARCGPLGGIYTALKRSRAETILFLACDMPFVSSDLLAWMLEKFERRGGAKALFASDGGKAGFPCVLPREDALSTVKQQIEAGDFALQSLSKRLNARICRVPTTFSDQLANLNTPQELARASKRSKVS